MPRLIAASRNATERPPKPIGLRHLTCSFSKKRGAWHFHFNVPAKDVAAGCPVRSTTLRCDQETAQTIVDNRLWCQYEAWKLKLPATPQKAKGGTLDWKIETLKTTRLFLGEEGHPHAARVVYENGIRKVFLTKAQKSRIYHLRLLADHRLDDGRRLGEVSLHLITPLVREALIEALVWTVRYSQEKKSWLMTRREPTRNHILKYARSAWNIVASLYPEHFPSVNPFSNMRLREISGEVPAFNIDQRDRFIASAHRKRHPSIVNAAYAAWEFLQRKTHLIFNLRVEDWRPVNAPDFVFIEHLKNGQFAWMPLLDDEGVPLFPEIMAAFDRAKGERTTGPLIYRDDVFAATGEYVPWAQPGGSTSEFDRVVDEILVDAGLRPPKEKRKEFERYASFRSIRNGGLTELGESGLSNVQITHMSRQLSVAVINRYQKRTIRIMIESQLMRIKARSTRKPGDDPFLSQSLQRPVRVEVPS